MNNELYRRRLTELQSKLPEERQWWDKKKASIQEGFMKELDADASSTKSAPSTAAPAQPVSSVQGSDDDAVLVEAAPTASPAGGGKKKKKGKK